MAKSIMPDEADMLWQAASQVPEGGTIVEIGSFRGSSTYAMALACEGRNVKIYAVDTWMGSPGGIDEWGPKRGVTSVGSFLPEFKNNLAEFINSGVVIPLEMSSAGALMCEPRLEPYLVFIDGSHVYEDVLFDVTYWWPRVKQGGAMAVHDTTGDKDWHPQVKQALDCFLKRNNLKLFRFFGCTSWLKK